MLPSKAIKPFSDVTTGSSYLHLQLAADFMDASGASTRTNQEGCPVLPGMTARESDRLPSDVEINRRWENLPDGRDTGIAARINLLVVDDHSRVALIDARSIRATFASSVQLERCTPLFLAASWKGVAPVVPRLNYDGDTPYFVLSRRGTGRCALASAADLYGKQYRNFRRRNAEKIEPRVAGGPARRFTARYWPASAAQPFRDAEFLLVNGLDAYLQRFLALAEPPASRRAGVVYLTTERLPCERCVETMRMFLADYPRFRLAIGFMHAHGAQQVSMIQAALGSRAALFGFAFA